MTLISYQGKFSGLSSRLGLCSMTAQIFSVPDDVSETEDTNKRALDHDHIARNPSEIPTCRHAQCR
jgi:hypothetical protein